LQRPRSSATSPITSVRKDSIYVAQTSFQYRKHELADRRQTAHWRDAGAGHCGIGRVEFQHVIKCFVLQACAQS
jgi:hypothetical protein